MKGLLLVGLGGAAGAVSRYLVSGWVQGWLRQTTFPYGTLAVNLTGSFLIGLLFTLAGERGWLSPDARLLAMIGFLGAYTTFSTFSVETVLLLRTGEIARALLNVGANNLFCLLGAWLGLSLPGLLWR